MDLQVAMRLQPGEVLIYTGDPFQINDKVDKIFEGMDSWLCGGDLLVFLGLHDRHKNAAWVYSPRHLDGRMLIQWSVLSTYYDRPVKARPCPTYNMAEQCSALGIEFWER